MRWLIPALAGVLAAAAAAGAQPDRPNRPYRPARDEAWRTVDGWYQQYLHRPPGNIDYGKNDWADGLRNGTPPDAVLAGILGSEEYYGLAGGTPEGFVRQLFRDIVGRDPTRPEFRGWMRRLETQERSELAHDLLDRFPDRWQPGLGVDPRDLENPDYDYRRPSYRYYRP
jgi:hypothetical protein